MIGQVLQPPHSVMNGVYLANSVNPKTFCHGNTELNPTLNVGKSVESRDEASQRDEGVLRTTGKLVECRRNDGIMHSNMHSNKVCYAHDGRRNRDDLISGSQRYRYLSVPQHHWVCGDWPSIKAANSVNAKAKCYANAELSLREYLNKCVQNIYRLLRCSNDMFGTCGKPQELLRNAVAV